MGPDMPVQEIQCFHPITWEIESSSITIEIVWDFGNIPLYFVRIS